MGKILLVCLAEYLIDVGCYYFHFNYLAQQPLFVGAVIGAILGDIRTGIIMGGYLQAIFMGNLSIGGTIPAVPGPGTVIAVYYVITSGVDIEQGLALAVPISALISPIYSLFRTSRLAQIPFWQNIGLEKKDGKKFDTLYFCYFLLQSVLFSVIVFISLAFGVDLLTNLMSKMPAWVMTACGAVGGVLASVGIGVILSLVWNVETAGFFFIGFICFKILGMSMTSCSIVACGIALVYYFIDSKLRNHERLLAGGVKPADTDDNGGDFF